MDGGFAADDLRGLVDDRVEQGVFRVRRAAYTDPRIFELETARIFERCWMFLCHESQIPEHGDYFWTEIARQRQQHGRQAERKQA